jgi:hypothetical protein
MHLRAELCSDSSTLGHAALEHRRQDATVPRDSAAPPGRQVALLILDLVSYFACTAYGNFRLGVQLSH